MARTVDYVAGAAAAGAEFGLRGGAGDAFADDAGVDVAGGC